MGSLLTVYFCGISGRFHLDYANQVDFYHKLNIEAKVKGVWYEKVEKRFRIVLGSNIKTFLTEQDAVSYAETQFKLPVKKYEMIQTTGITSWQAKSKKEGHEFRTS
jgi:hypothetical protein